MESSFRVRRSFHEENRQRAKEFRFQFWQLRATMEAIDESSDRYLPTHARLQAIIVQWRRHLRPAALELKADHDDIAALWEPLSALEASVGLEDLKPPERLLTAGRRLNNLTILLVDAPTPPPVVDDLWHPDDEEPVEEAISRLRVEAEV